MDIPILAIQGLSLSLLRHSFVRRLRKAADHISLPPRPFVSFFPAVAAPKQDRGWSPTSYPSASGRMDPHQNQYSYPYPAQGYYQTGYYQGGPPVMPPPQYVAPPPPRSSGFLQGCLAALCCCCLIDECCCDPSIIFVS